MIFRLACVPKARNSSSRLCPELPDCQYRSRSARSRNSIKLRLLLIASLLHALIRYRTVKLTAVFLRFGPRLVPNIAGTEPAEQTPQKINDFLRFRAKVAGYSAEDKREG